MSDIVMVFTGKSLGTMIKEGGSGHWRANESNLRKSKYVICTRNCNAEWSELDQPHGKGFLIGKIKGIERSPEYDTPRYVIQISEYAEIDFPQMWPGNHNPVAYMDFGDLLVQGMRIDPEALDWKPFPAPEAVADPVAAIKPLSIQEAKLGVAKMLGIDPACVKILIEA